MSSRPWQIAAAVVSVGVMVYVLIVFGLRDDDAAAPTTAAGSQPHVGAQHHTAEPHEGDKLAPLQVYAGSVVGEWLAYETITQLADSEPRPRPNLVRVEAVDDTHVTLVHTEREGSLSPLETQRDELPRQGLTIDQLVASDAAHWTISGVTVSDDTKAVGGRAFKCKKLSFAMRSPLASEKQANVEMWISEEVPAGGLVELRQVFPATRLEMTHRLIGFGTATATTWGKKPEGLEPVMRDARD